MQYFNSDLNGFSVTFANGYRVSVRWSHYNYCDNRMMPDNDGMGSSDAEVFIIAKNGSVVGEPRAYGYGEYYLQRAGEWLEENGYMPDREHYPSGNKEQAWCYFADRDVPFHYSAVNVQREKDL